MKLVRVHHVSSKMGNGRVAYVSPKCSANEYFLFSHIEPFGYVNVSNEGTVRFSAKFVAISLSVRK